MTPKRSSPPTGASKRLEDRYKVTLQVRLTLLGRKTFELETSDISYHGLYLKTSNPPDLRALVKLAVDLPSGKTLQMHGMAVYVRLPGDPSGRTAGVGVQFYAVDKDTQSVWIEQVRTLAKALAANTNSTDKSDRREHPRYAAELDLELRTLDDLHQLYTRDVSEGGMFVVTEVLLPLGEKICIHVLHPATGRAFPLDAVVRRQEFHPTRGLGVEFVGMDTARRAAFVEFIHGSIELGDDDVFEVVDIDLMAG